MLKLLLDEGWSKIFVTPSGLSLFSPQRQGATMVALLLLLAAAARGVLVLANQEQGSGVHHQAVLLLLVALMRPHQLTAWPTSIIGRHKK